MTTKRSDILTISMATCALAAALLGAGPAEANRGQRRVNQGRPLAPSSVQRNAAFHTLFQSLGSQKQDFFFRPKEANRFRRGATLPVVTDKQIEASHQKPQRLSRETYIFGGHIFMNRFYMRSRGRGGAGYSELRALSNAELIGRQPWIEWDAGRGHYRFHGGGATAKLRELVKTTTIYRGMSFGEAGVWKRIKRQLDDGRARPGCSQQAPRLSNQLRIALNNLSPTHRSTFCTPTFSAAEGWSRTSLWKRGQSGRVLKFGVDLKAVPAALSSQVYLGIEDGYVEVGFFNARAKAFLAGRLLEAANRP